VDLEGSGMDLKELLDARSLEIQQLSQENLGTPEWVEAASLALSLLHDTVGGAHPLAATIRHAMDKGDFFHAAAGARTAAKLYDVGGLKSARLAIAHELEGDILEMAQQQVSRAETAAAETKTVFLGIAAFLAGAALEDCLRRLCEANQRPYDPQNSSIAKFQAALYQPTNGITIISASENKQVTAWGATRNSADHGKLSELTQSDVLSMVIGVRGFVDRHMP
jgi:hypothetical protein